MKFISVKKIGRGNMKGNFLLTVKSENQADYVAINILSGEAGDNDYLRHGDVYTLNLSHSNLIYGIVKLSRFFGYE